VFTVDVSSDDGSSWVRARTWRSTFDTWRQIQIRLLDWIPLTNQVRVRFQFGDTSFPSLVEGALDDVRIFDVDTTTPVLLSGFRTQQTPAGILLQWDLPRQPGNTVQSIDVQRAPRSEGPFTTRARLEPSARSWVDADVPSEDTLWYRLVLHTASGSVVGPVLAAQPHGGGGDRIESAQENADGTVQLSYSLERGGPVSLSVYDIRGRRILDRDLGHQPAGTHVQTWDRRDDQGVRVGRGLVVVTLDVAGHVTRRKLLLRH